MIHLMLLLATADAASDKLDLIPLNARTTLSYVCKSDGDITVHFKRNTTQMIAQCKSALNVCYLMNPSLGQYYGVANTGQGVVFNVINGIEETRGSYVFCREHTINCVTIEIGLENSSTTENTTDRNIPQKDKTAGTPVVESHRCNDVVLIIINLAVLIMIALVHYRLTRPRVCSWTTVADKRTCNIKHKDTETAKITLLPLFTDKNVNMRSINCPSLKEVYDLVHSTDTGFDERPPTDHIAVIERESTV